MRARLFACLFVCLQRMILHYIIALLSAAIFGNVSSIMLRVYQGTEEYREKMESIKEFIKFHQIAKTLGNRLQESFQHSWTYTNGIDMNNVSNLHGHNIIHVY